MIRVTMRVSIDSIEADKPLIYTSRAKTENRARRAAIEHATRRIVRQGWRKEYEIKILAVTQI